MRMLDLGAGLATIALAWLAGFGVPLLIHRRSRLATAWSLECASLGGITGMVLGAGALVGGGAQHLTILSGGRVPSVRNFPALDLDVYLDPLAGLFLLLISFFAVIISIYSFSFLQKEPDRVKIAAIYNLYLLSLVFVVVANNVFFFLLFWELMTLTSAYLVLYRHNKLADAGKSEGTDYEDAVTSPQVYLVASHFSTVLIAVALLGLAAYAQQAHYTNVFDFRTLKEFAAASAQSPALPLDWIFVVALVGLGIKAGMVPFHFWLPYAHPSSPANIHAMMSGVMIKIAVYAMLRLFFEFLQPVGWWWGVLLVALASLTTLVGVLYAIFNSNLKTALAYHSIENIGIILVGIGTALIFRWPGFPAASGNLLATLALIAALYHLVNHAVFKGLLFLCTGAIEQLTKTVDMEKLGGLALHFPWTTALFIAGALAIAGFPPFNGFVSEWFVVQSLLTGLDQTAISFQLFAQPLTLLLALVLLANAFALTAFCFLKVVVTVFLGQPGRLAEPEQWLKRDVPWAMRGVLLLLAGMCVVLGLFPSQVINLFTPITARLTGSAEAVPVVSMGWGLQLSLPPPLEAWGDLEIIPMVGIGLLVALGAYTLRGVTRRQPSPAAPQAIWSCGSPILPAQSQWTEAALSFWVGHTFGAMLGQAWSRMFSRRPMVGQKAFLRDEMRLSDDAAAVEVFRRALNRGLDILVTFSETFGSEAQNKDIRRYLTYIFVVILLAFVILIPS